MFHNHLKTFLPVVLITSVESHADGKPHIHAFLKFSRKETVNSCDHFDFRENHCNIESVRSAIKVMKYVTKDNNVLLYGITLETLNAIKEKGLTTLALACRSIVDDPSTFDSVILESPELLARHPSGMEKIRKFATRIATKTTVSSNPIRQPLPSHPDNVQWAVCAWLHKNMKRDRAHKQSQLWLWSTLPGMGKTSLIQFLDKHYRVYYIPQDENWYDLYDDNSYDLAVLDDYNRASKKLSWLNRFLEGAAFHLSQRNSGCVKRDNIPVIICSNLPPDQIYSRTRVINTLLARIDIIEVTRPLFPFDYIKFESYL